MRLAKQDIVTHAAVAAAAAAVTERKGREGRKGAMLEGGDEEGRGRGKGIAA